ncbi:MAG TPA: Ig-like domain-containing protein [Candidatus Limnocylindrales bacterium]|nr:Ig-like domain-containing protein [Candidatus Limnocylindrales bacterium]
MSGRRRRAVALLAIVATLVSVAPGPARAVPGPPTADGQSLRTPQDTALPITLVGHDASNLGIMSFVATDPANGTLTPSLGSMTCNSSGQNCSAAVTYTPDPGYQGLDSFTFTVTDSYVPPETSAPATVSITVNAPPVAIDDPGSACQAPNVTGGSFPIPEDWPEPLWMFGDCSLVANDTDPDGDSLIYEVDTLPSNGDLTFVDSVSVAYQPDPDYSTIAGDQPGGTWVSDTVVYTAFDGFEHSGQATLRIWVAPINDPPSFTPGADVVVNEDSGAYSATWATAVSPGPANEGAQTVDFEIVNLDVTGVPNLFAVDPAISSTGVLTFTPGPNEVGLATVTVRAVDDGGLEDYDVVHAGLPVPDDTSDEATFTIAVIPVADAPVAQDTSASTDEETPVEIDLVASDAEGDSLVFDVADPPNGSIAYGTLSCGAGTCTQRVTYTPDVDYIGTDTFTFTAVASTPPTTSNTATVTVTIGNVNDAPSFTKGANQTVLEDSGLRTVTGWATDISPGVNEAGQAIDFEVTNNTNTGLFSAGPAVADNGTLTFTPAANANGTATITLRLDDVEGGSSATQTFSITVTSVNDAPTYTKGANASVLEDSGAETVSGWASAMSPGPADESAQTLTFAVVGNTVPALFSVAPTVDEATGDLDFTVAANAFGTSTITLRLSDTGGTANGGVSSSEQTFTITVVGVNDQPSFTKGADQVDLEDAGAQSVPGWATAISAGPSEASQTVSFEVTDNTNVALFAVQPAVAANGTLTYTPAANAHGTATITIVLHDSAGTANGGIDTSSEATFTIDVDPVNDAPTFTKGPNEVVPDDSGAHVVNGWATGMSAGPADEAGQELEFSVVGNTLPALFSVGPAVDAVTGDLSYTVAPGINGLSTITLRLADDGGTADGGVDHSDQTFTITIGEVNDPPTFTKGANQSWAEDGGARSVPGWATAISAGGSGEAGQALSFLVTGNTNTALFSAQPAVSASGTLTFTPASNRNGTATISLVLKDDGGTANGGVDTSATATFTITITPVNDPPNAANDVGLTVKQNTATSLAVLANDTALPDTGETLTIVAKTNGAHGTVTITGGGTGIRYTPAATYRGSDVFTYTISDGALTDTATVLLTVVQTGTVTRLAGADRYATSAAISAASYGANVPVAYIASGLGFPDALSGAPVAGKAGGPILLVPGTSIPAVIAAELTRLKPAKIVILGGTGVVSAGVQTSLGVYTAAPS